MQKARFFLLSMAAVLSACASQPEPPLQVPVPIVKDEELTVEKLDTALDSAYRTLASSIPQNGRVGVVGIRADDPAAADFIAQGFIERLVANRNKNGNKYSVADRNKLELLRKEQKLQLSGAVSDETILSISKWLGLSYQITGSLSQMQHQWVLNFVGTDVETTEIRGISNEVF